MYSIIQWCMAMRTGVSVFLIFQWYTHTHILVHQCFLYSSGVWPCILVCQCFLYSSGVWPWMLVHLCVFYIPVGYDCILCISVFYN